MARRLQLDRNYLVAMARSPEFYTAVPAFYYLREAAAAAWKEAQANQDCQKCGSHWKYMRGVCDAIFLKLKEMKAEDDPALQDVKRWISSRKGYRVDRCVLYYRRSRTQGRIAKLEF